MGKTGENNGTYPTWKWVSTILVGALVALIGYTIGGGLSDSRVDAREIRVKLEQTCDRVTILETNYKHIVQYMEKSDQFQQRMEKVITRIEKNGK